jgi:hypothetical protein
MDFSSTTLTKTKILSTRSLGNVKAGAFAVLRVKIVLYPAKTLSAPVMAGY